MYVSWISMSPLPLVSGGVHFLDHASSGSKQASIRAILAAEGGDKHVAHVSQQTFSACLVSLQATGVLS